MSDMSSAFGEAAFEQVNLNPLTPLNRYKFLTASVVPRPIALVSTIGPTGLVNVAPFSQFIILSATPPILGIVSGQYSDGIKDTHAHILRTQQFVINVVDEDLAQATQACAFPFRSDQSEAEVVGLDTLDCTTIDGRRLAASPMSFECRLERTERFGETATLIAGEVVAVHARAGLVSGHRVDHRKLKPLGRIAGRSYCRTREVVEMPDGLDDPYRQYGRELRS